jgi:hypothetical protein
MSGKLSVKSRHERLGALRRATVILQKNQVAALMRDAEGIDVDDELAKGLAPYLPASLSLS